MSEHGLASLMRPKRKPRVLLVGDMILDRYQYGDTSRISPEAPILVLAASHEELRLGGCGNVAANLAALGADVRCIAVVGPDEAAETVRELLRDAGVDSTHLVRDDQRPTIRKTRLVAQNQQLIRVDEERTSDVSGGVEALIIDAIEQAMAEVDIIVVSDYGKGTLSDGVLDQICRSDVPNRPRVVVDPKGRDYTRYRGASILTPNRLETLTATGIELDDMDGVRRAAQALCAMADLEAAIITLGARGMYCLNADGTHECLIPARVRAVFDVTGAGDTAIATLAFALASGADLEQAMQLANAAAGITVQRFGVAAVTPAEIQAAVDRAMPSSGKIVDREELLERVALQRRAGRTVVFTNGCFDVLHAGHLEYLEHAAHEGDMLIVGVNDDDSVRRLKGENRPVNMLADRMTLLAGFECVALVTAFSEDTPLQIIEAVTPDVLVKGEDWADKGVVGREWVESHGGHVVLAKLKDGYSSTSMLQRMNRD